MTTFSQFQNLLPFSINREERTGYALLVAWVLAMVSLPIAVWTIGESAIPIGVTFAAILQACAVFYIVQQQWGLRRTTIVFLIVAVISWFAEFIGHTTHFPFGAYDYTKLLQPQIVGVPLLIPIAWFMLLPSSWVMAQLIVGIPDTWRKRLAFVGVSAIALTAWDLFLDPQMVGWSFWVWENPSGYFGIPYSNYAGWLLVAAVITFAANPQKLKVMPLALVYGVVWFLQTFGQAFFWGQVGPAIVGSIAMGGIMLLACWRSKSQ